jgi:aryl-alcohol dehydrogenase-like predicted oxidoreductase
MRSINVLSIQRMSADDRAKIAASDPAIRLIDAGGWFDGEIRENWTAFAAARYLPPGATGSGSRKDYDTPIEETLEALHDIVKAGKARYIGASSMHAWQFARALGIAERHGWTRFVSMQNLVNLLYREEEREMLPLCAAEGIGVIPWSPQARGTLTRDSNYTSIRTETDEAFGRLFAKTEGADRKVVDRVAQVAAARGIPRAQVALAWLLAKPVITAPIVGATKLQHLDDALASVHVRLSEDEMALLEEPYVPHAVVGFD